MPFFGIGGSGTHCSDCWCVEPACVCCEAGSTIAISLAGFSLPAYTGGNPIVNAGRIWLSSFFGTTFIMDTIGDLVDCDCIASEEIDTYIYDSNNRFTLRWSAGRNYLVAPSRYVQFILTFNWIVGNPLLPSFNGTIQAIYRVVDSEQADCEGIAENIPTTSTSDNTTGTGNQMAPFHWWAGSDLVTLEWFAP